MPTTYLWQWRLGHQQHEPNPREVEEFNTEPMMNDVRACGDDAKAMVKIILRHLSSVSKEHRRLIAVECYKQTSDEALVNHAFETAIGCV